MACAIQVGYFLARLCGEPTACTCAKCRRETCRAHSKSSSAGEWLCVECFAGSSSRRSTRDDSSDSIGSSSSSSSSSSTSSASSGGSSSSADFEQGGGAFGGGGSSGGWIPAAPLGGGNAGVGPQTPRAPGMPGDALREQGFTPEDIAAFDQVSSGEALEDEVYDS